MTLVTNLWSLSREVTAPAPAERNMSDNLARRNT
jgi:hypothetical protein